MADNSLSDGRVAKELGLYDQAIAALEGAILKDEEASEPRELLAACLRQNQINCYLIGNYLDYMGFSKDYYRGFSHLEELPDDKESFSRLSLLAGELEERESGDPLRLKILGDYLAQSRNEEAKSFTKSYPDEISKTSNTEAYCDFMFGRELRRSGDFKGAEKKFFRTINTTLCGHAHRLLGQIFYCSGEFLKAARHFKVSELYPITYWSVFAVSKERTDPVIIGRQRGLIVLYEVKDYQQRISAVSGTVEDKLLFQGGNLTNVGDLELNIYKSSPSLRKKLKKLLPDFIVKWLKFICKTKLMSSLIMVRVNLENFVFRETDMEKFMEYMEDDYSERLPEPEMNEKL